MDGLFGRPLAWPEISTTGEVNAIPHLKDFVNHVDSATCMRFSQIKKAVGESQRTRVMYKKMLNFWQEELFPKLSELTGETSDLSDVAKYLAWAMRNNLSLKFQLSDLEKRMIFAMDDQMGFIKYPFSTSYELEALPNYQFFKIFDEFVDLVQGKPWTDTTYFTRYFKKPHTHPFPKFIMFSGHAETLAPLLSAFGRIEFSVKRPRPGSALFLEFYREEGQINVRVYYKATLNREEELGTWTIH